MSDPTNLSEYRFQKNPRPAVPVMKADAMVMTHLAGCAMQLNLIQHYFIDAGLLNLAEKIGKISMEVNDICKQPVDAH